MDTSLVAALTGLAAHALAEPLMRHREARSTETTDFEHGTTALVSALGLLAVALALGVRGAGAELGGGPGTAGSAVLAAVLFGAAALRYWSMGVLGRFFTRTLRVAEGHRLVEAGPYRLVRHPGYLANLLAYASATTLIAESALFGAIVLLGLGLAYAFRIHHEERMLLASLGEAYREYQARTSRLVPWVY
jgi:protein-S-isoprenylcysteine O-methyltransferase Ste14